MLASFINDQHRKLFVVLRANKSTAILTSNQGKPWATGFKSSWRKAVEKAGIKGKTFHDLRGTFVTLAYRNGASIKEISEVSGTLKKDAESIIRKHYLV